MLATQSRGRARRDLVAQIGNHTVKSGSTLQSLTACSVGDAEIYAVVKGGQVGLSLRSMYKNLGIPMKIEIQSDSSTSHSLTARLGRTKHIDTRYFWIQERVQDGDLSIKKVLSTTTTLQVCRIGILLTMDPTLHYKMKVMKLMLDLVKGLQPRFRQRPDVITRRQREHRNIQLSTLIVNIEADVQAE